MWILSIAVLLCARQEPGIEPAAVGRQAVEPSRSGQVLRMYDVSDLLDSLLTDFEPPTLGISEVDAKAREEAAARSAPITPRLGAPAPQADPRQLPTTGSLFEAQADERARAGKTLEGIVKQYMTPPISGPVESVKTARAGVLVANLLPEQQAWLEAFLTTQRVFLGFVTVEAQLFTVRRGVLRSIGIESTAVVLNAADRSAFEAQLRGKAKAQLITDQTVALLPNQRGNVSVLNQVSYVKDYTLQIVEPNQQEIADPEIAVIQEGVVLDVRATPTAEGEFGLDLELTNSELMRPIRTKKVRISTAHDSEVEIGLPEVSTIRIATTSRIADGASIVLSTPGRGDTDLVLVLRARHVQTFERGQFGQEALDER